MVFHRKVTAHELAPLLSRAALMIAPSREESFGIVYQESLCSGTPFIGYPPTVRACSTVDRHGESYERCDASLVEGRSAARG